MKKQTHLHLVRLKGEYIFSKFKFLDELFLKYINYAYTYVNIESDLLFLINELVTDYFIKWHS